MPYDSYRHHIDVLNAEIEALRITLADIAAELPLSKLLAAIVERASRFFQASDGQVMLYDHASERLVLYASYNVPEDVIGSWIRLGEGLGGRVVLSKQPFMVDDYRTWEGRVADYPGPGPYPSLSVPLLAGDELIGVINVGRRDSPHVFTSEDVRRLGLYAEQAAVAIKNARLLETARRRAEEAETLRRVGAVVASTLRQDEAIERILEQLALVVPYDSASVQLLRGENSEIVGGRGFQDRGVIGMHFPLDGDNPANLVYGLRAPVRLEDARAAFSSFHEPPHDAIRSWLGAPMIFQERVIGMITVDSAEPQRFTDDHERIVAAFADQAAIALENARLFAETRRLAITDPLIGAYNRRHFFELANAEMERSIRYQHSLAIVMIDIDDFKRVNDTYGHLVGDQVLRSVAQRCRGVLRTIDVLGRYGGEELVVLLPETALAGALEAAERLRLAIADTPIEADGVLVPVTASFGVACRDSASPRPSGLRAESGVIDEVVDHADRALYHAKRAGRNRVHGL